MRFDAADKGKAAVISADGTEATGRDWSWTAVAGAPIAAGGGERRLTVKAVKDSGWPTVGLVSASADRDKRPGQQQGTE